MRINVNLTLSFLLLAGVAPCAMGMQLDDRILWRFEMPSNFVGAYSSVGADGTIYTTDNSRLYAVNPDGTLQWSRFGAGGGRPITFGDDGTIYTGVASVSAVNPDGTLKWVYRPPTLLKLAAGPNVGPDGNIYTMQETMTDGDGIGMFVVNADGNLLWSNRGDPAIGLADLVRDSEVVFGTNRLFAGDEMLQGSGAVTYAFGYDGQQEWYSGIRDLNLQTRSFPRMLPDGRLVFVRGTLGLMVIQPDGTVDWTMRHPNGAGDLVLPAVGPDGIIYTGDWSGLELWSVNPDGTTRWVQASTAGHLDRLFVSPDNNVLIATGDGGFGQTGWVRGYDPQDGALLWQVDLEPEQGLNHVGRSAGVGFSQDNSTVYLTTGFLANGVGHTYMYAIRIADSQSYALSLTNLVGGSDARFTIEQATPNTNQYIVYSLRGLGSTFVPQLNVTLDLRQPVLLTSGRANAQGEFETIVHVPSAATGRTVWFQAAEMNRTTPVFSEIVR